METGRELTRGAGGGSLSDADLIFGQEGSSYKMSRFGASKSMSVASDRPYASGSSYYGGTGSGTGTKGALSSSGSGAAPSYRIYEGIQNAAFSDYSDVSSSGSLAKIGDAPSSYAARRSQEAEEEEEDDFDLK